MTLPDTDIRVLTSVLTVTLVVVHKWFSHSNYGQFVQFAFERNNGHVSRCGVVFLVNMFSCFDNHSNSIFRIKQYKCSFLGLFDR